MIKNNSLNRNSSFELMRLMLMFFIMWHHFIYALDSSMVTAGIKTLDTFFHTAVLCFVLLSGYYGIRFKVSRFLELLVQVIFYSVLMSCISIIFWGNGNWKDIIKSFIPFTNGYYWFIAVYLQLYLLSPFVNIILQKIDNRQIIALLSTLAFLIFYVGLLRGGNVGVDGGKNIINFVFIYCIGSAMHRIEPHIRLNMKRIRIMAFLMINFILVLFFLFYALNSSLHKELMMLTYSYQSPGLLLLSVCIFLVFATNSFHNSVLNQIAKSSLAIYLLHEHPLMKNVLYRDYFSNYYNSQIGLLYKMLFFSLVIGTIAIVIDRIRLSLFSLISPYLKRLDSRINKQFLLL